MGQYGNTLSRVHLTQLLVNQVRVQVGRWEEHAQLSDHCFRRYQSLVSMPFPAGTKLSAAVMLSSISTALLGYVYVCVGHNKGSAACSDQLYGPSLHLTGAMWAS